jgi:hypothetical protein
LSLGGDLGGIRNLETVEKLTCVNELHKCIEEVLASAQYILLQQNHPTS